ncbi:MAG: hypothetical protein COA50_09920 [Flavobacteriaceae bacterium]|nr:MAG: hypothetical protein COA50_09920 [Flavobacteriaceae bacterium]
MKKILLVYLILLGLFTACDPQESLDVFIKNSTNTNLKVHFVSAQILLGIPDNTETLNIKSGERENYPEMSIFSPTSRVKLSLTNFDSIYITNTTDDILKVYKAANAGKNIYDIKNYWTVKSVTKNHDEYTYEITNEDLD